MKFEFDPAKSAANKAKHGVDFVEAQAMWAGTAAIRRLPHLGEERLLRIGLVGDRLWAAVFTMRGGGIRLISVRRARRGEEAEFGRQTE